MKKILLKIVLVTMGCLFIVGCGKTDTNKVNNSERIETTKDSTYDMFQYDISEIDKESYRLYSCDGIGDEQEITIPDEYEGKPVIEIGDNVFINTGIKKVQLGSNIQVIEEYAFSSNYDLSKVNFNDKLKDIKLMAFADSGLIGNIVFPDSLENIGVSAFGGTEIESVEFGKNIKYIAGGAFGTRTLKRAIFNNTDVEIDVKAFNGCKDLTIVAPKGSTAEKYAKDNNINFEER